MKATRIKRRRLRGRKLARRPGRYAGVTTAQHLKEARLQCELQVAVIALSKIELRRARNRVRSIERTRQRLA